MFSTNELPERRSLLRPTVDQVITAEDTLIRAIKSGSALSKESQGNWSVLISDYLNDSGRYMFSDRPALASIKKALREAAKAPQQPGIRSFMDAVVAEARTYISPLNEAFLLKLVTLIESTCSLTGLTAMTVRTQLPDDPVSFLLIQNRKINMTVVKDDFSIGIGKHSTVENTGQISSENGATVKKRFFSNPRVKLTSSDYKLEGGITTCKYAILEYPDGRKLIANDVTLVAEGETIFLESESHNEFDPQGNEISSGSQKSRHEVPK